MTTSEDRIEEILDIPVTRRHINQGAQMNGSLCPIALAIKARMGPSCAPIKVNPGATAIGEPPEMKVYANDVALREWIKSFDIGKSAEPFTLRLIRRGNKHQARKEPQERSADPANLTCIEIAGGASRPAARSTEERTDAPIGADCAGRRETPEPEPPPPASDPDKESLLILSPAIQSGAAPAPPIPAIP